MTVRVNIPAAGGRKAFSIYTPYIENLNYFLKTPVTVADLPAVTNKQVGVRAHQRRQYPGDTALSNIPSTDRTVLVDPGRRSGNGLPGRSVVLVAEVGLPGEERRQFTVVGRWVDFHAWLGGQAKMEIKAYNHTGAWNLIPAAGTTP
jgi:hypothetical protein